ncbi:MAG: ATP-binding protein [Bacteroidota bacterium]
MGPGNGSGAFENDYNEFIDMAVHDLDAPLRKLSLLVGMLTDKLPHDKNIQTYSARIENCVVDMRSLIDDLYVLAKISDKGKFTACNIDTIIKELLPGLPSPVKEKKPVINTSSLPIIEGDAVQYRLLFKNLLENAIKFSSAGTLSEIQIRSSVLTSNEKDSLDLQSDMLYYKIEIADNSIGFKQENAEKIFRPFVRLHEKSRFPGNGIGLAVCKKIIDIHHGIIYAESRENEGSRFILVLPERH